MSLPSPQGKMAVKLFMPEETNINDGSQAEPEPEPEPEAKPASNPVLRYDQVYIYNPQCQGPAVSNYFQI